MNTMKKQKYHFIIITIMKLNKRIFLSIVYSITTVCLTYHKVVLYYIMFWFSIFCFVYFNIINRIQMNTSICSSLRLIQKQFHWKFSRRKNSLNLSMFACFIRLSKSSSSQANIQLPNALFAPQSTSFCPKVL